MKAETPSLTDLIIFFPIRNVSCSPVFSVLGLFPFQASILECDLQYSQYVKEWGHTETNNPAEPLRAVKPAGDDRRVENANKSRTCGWRPFPGETAPVHSGDPGRRCEHLGSDVVKLL